MSIYDSKSMRMLSARDSIGNQGPLQLLISKLDSDSSKEFFGVTHWWMEVQASIDTMKEHLVLGLADTRSCRPGAKAARPFFALPRFWN